VTVSALRHHALANSFKTSNAVVVAWPHLLVALASRNHPIALLMPQEGAVAVGTAISLRPPHRSRRALLTHRAPTLDGDEEPLFRPRVQDAWKRQVPVSDLLHSRPR
jgi:hypothetical protein